LAKVGFGKNKAVGVLGGGGWAAYLRWWGCLGKVGIGKNKVVIGVWEVDGGVFWVVVV
jgi:hypothetical protein